jgi:hypothetical protein
MRDRIAKDRHMVLLAQGLRAPAELGDQLAGAVFEHVFLRRRHRRSDREWSSRRG